MTVFVALRNEAPSLISRQRKLEAVAKAARGRLEAGCNDTCSAALTVSSPCSCGDVSLARALAALDGDA